MPVDLSAISNTSDLLWITISKLYRRICMVVPEQLCFVSIAMGLSSELLRYLGTLLQNLSVHSKAQLMYPLATP